MRIVIDTNVIASAIFFGGKPDRLVSLLMAGKLEAYVSDAIIAEYRRTEEHLARKYSARETSASLDDILGQCNCVSPAQTVSVCRDKDDNKFIECALAGKCLYIVSGDADLLDLKSYADIEIVTVAEFFGRYGNQFAD
ncbi:MAG: putative toxin-antitoxin system toxin component, PIN family [Treponemataceae bacterium]|nr:putative toxin-antitoxin system toxin component, PIN family [Treponemataceae bacterium]MDE7392472.1 putative toxin-antitoxin system toxin component, PIN family [Treponemataceae bacterium]